MISTKNGVHMRSRQLQAILAEWTSSSVGEVDQRVRGARKAGAISSGPRGAYAPSMNLAEVAQHILCLASRKVVDAEETRKRLSTECIVAWSSHGAPPFPAGTTFSDVVEMILNHEIPQIEEAFRDGDLSMGHIEIGEDGRRAIWTLPSKQSAKPFRVIFDSDVVDREKYYPHARDPVEFAYALRTGFWFVLPCRYLFLLGRDLAKFGESDKDA